LIETKGYTMEKSFFGKTGFCINTEIERPAPSQIKELSQYPVALLGDGMGRLSVMDPGIKPLLRSVQMCGPAITVEVHPADNLMIHVAMKIAQKGDVIIVNARGNIKNGIYGDILNSVAKRKELGGIVIDGAIRDCVEIEKSGVPVFSRGICPLGGGKEGPGQVNVPISCGGVVINPGDMVVGDGDGIVVVPRGLLQGAIDGAKKKEQAESKRLDTIANGKDDEIYPSWLIPTLRAKGILKDSETI
jgi:4-hydroxy-4-methyl-2-oxoglutarate aldolase